MDIIDVLEDLMFLETISQDIRQFKVNTEWKRIKNSRQWKRKKDTRQGPPKIVKPRKKSKFCTSGAKIEIDKTPELFYEATRMTCAQFDALLKLVEPRLRKFSRRQPIEPEHRLFITLEFLAHGCSLHVISMKFGIGLETARSIILDTCGVLWDVLGSIYLSPPTESQWKDIANGFWEKFQLPNCVGALDGKHIRMKCPPRSGSQCYNYKKLNSIVLMAACDSNYSFTLVDVDDKGSQSDGNTFKNSSFGNMLQTNEIGLPNPICLPWSTQPFPFYFVSDTAFPLCNNLIKPYSQVSDVFRENFNERICRARIRIEIAFGILTSRWQILRTPIAFSLENAKKVILATIVLHNYLRHLLSTEPSVSLEENVDNFTLPSVSHIDLNTPNTSSQQALQNRNILRDYLLTHYCPYEDNCANNQNYILNTENMQYYYNDDKSCLEVNCIAQLHT